MVKNQKGFTSAVVIVAIAIIALFVGLVATISYNVYLASVSSSRISRANYYIVTIFERIERTPFEGVDENEIVAFFNTTYAPTARANSSEHSAYRVTISVEYYEPPPGNPNPSIEGLIKEITMTVQYNVGGREQTIEMTRIKQR